MFVFRSASMTVLLICLTGRLAAEPPLGDGAELVPQLEAKLAEMNCPGALVGIFPDEGPPRRFALGVASAKSDTPMPIDAHMRVASASKPFLATVVLKLVEAGKLDLDDPISKYVDGVPAGEKITLRMLGNNTSGLFNSIQDKGFQKAIMADPEKPWTPQEILNVAFRNPSYCEPGEKWRYSNTNAVLLALAAEKASGKTLSELLREYVFDPLGLEHTGVPVDGQLPEPRTDAYRHGYPDKVIGYGTVFYDVSNYTANWTGAAGNLYSTLDDLGKAARPVLMGELLNEKSRAEFHAWKPTGHQDADYGFMIYRRKGVIGHPGDVPGYNASFAYYPDLKTAVVVLTNLSNNADGTMPAEELAKLVVNHEREKKADR